MIMINELFTEDKFGKIAAYEDVDGDFYIQRTLVDKRNGGTIYLTKESAALLLPILKNYVES